MLPITQPAEEPTSCGQIHNTYAQLRGVTIEHNNVRQDDLQPVQVDAYLAKVADMLTAEEPHTLTAAIAAATGRRHTEVAVRGSFAATDHPYVLRFTGQQKKRDGHVDVSMMELAREPGHTAGYPRRR